MTVTHADLNEIGDYLLGDPLRPGDGDWELVDALWFDLIDEADHAEFRRSAVATAAPDYEVAYALLADELDHRRANTNPHPTSEWRAALLELAARALRFDPVTGLKYQTRSFLGVVGPPAPTLEQVNEILGRVGIAPLVLRELTPEEVWARSPISDLLDELWAPARERAEAAPERFAGHP